MTDLAALPFLNPVFVWFAAGLAGLPILIYILNRQRYRNVPWAAMRFLLAANQKTLRRTRLEHLLLMALRVALMALLGLAMARPVLKSAALLPTFAKGVYHIIVLDDSFSMSVAEGTPKAAMLPQTAFETQKQQALTLLREIPAGDPVSVITMGYPASRLNARPSTDTALLRRLIQTARAGNAHTDLLGGLKLVWETISEQRDDMPRQAVYLFSDFAKATLNQPAAAFGNDIAGGGVRSQPHAALESRSGAAIAVQDTAGRPTLKSLARQIAKEARLVLYDVYDGGTDNLAITELRPASSLVGLNRITELLCTITNLSDRRSGECTVQVRLNDTTIRRFTVEPLEARASQTLLVAVEFDSPGEHMIEATLTVEGGNVLKLDDRRQVVVQARTQVPVLLVDGKPGHTTLRGHAGYLAAALAPRSDTGEIQLLAPTITTETELVQRQLSPSELVVLCNVRRLESPMWRRLEDHVRSGGGLIIFAGDLVDIDHYNTVGNELLPARIIGLAFGEVSDANSVEFDAASLSGPLLADFQGRTNSGLFRAQTHQYFRTTVSLDVGRVLLAYTNKDPAVIERRVGAGRCMLVTTTANMDWTNLPAKGDYITLMMNLVQYVVPGSMSSRNFTVGDTFAEDVPYISGSGQEYQIQKPDGREQRLTIGAREGGFELLFDPLDQAGWYRLRSPEVSGNLSVNLNTAESDLTALDQAQIRRALDCEFDYIAVSPAQTQVSRAGPSEFASLLVYAVLLLLLAETLLAMWIDHERR